jgi:hypothetical protein
VRIRRPVHFIQAPFVPTELTGLDAVRHWMVMMPFALPTVEELQAVQVSNIIEQVKTTKRASKNDLSEANLRNTAEALRGLERHRATSILYYSIHKAGGLSTNVPRIIRKEVANQLAATGFIEVIDDAEVTPPEQIGGADNLIDAMKLSAITYTEGAVKQALDKSKGFWFAGMPGCGKSVVSRSAHIVFSRVTGQAWTGVRVSLGALYGGIVGATEQNWLDVERRIAAFGEELIVSLDELDKVFDDEAGKSSDVTASLLGLILNWLSSPARKCFVIMCMNAIDRIPAPLLREGRVDCGFFFDLPSFDSRIKILQIHFEKRLAKIDLALKDLKFKDGQWDDLGKITAAWIPSELEQLVVGARALAFQATGKGLPKFKDVMALAESKATGILAIQKKAELDKLRMSCAHARRIDIPTAVGDIKNIEKPMAVEAIRAIEFGDE